MASRGVVLGGMIWLLACAPATRADVTVNWPVDTVAVDGHCTLREAFAAANAPGAPSADCPGASPGGTTTIRVADDLTLAHASGQLEVLGGAQIALAGPGAASVTITADAPGSRFVRVDAGGQLALSGVRISGFTAPAGSDGSAAAGAGQSAPAAGSGASGGAILNNGTLTVDAVTFQGDHAGAGGNGATGGAGATGSFGGTGGAGGTGGSGGAIDNEGALTVTHSTFKSDSAGKGGNGGTGGAGGSGAAGASGAGGGGGGNDGGGGAGGAIYNGGTLVVSDTTFSSVAAGAAGNAGPGGAGGQGGDIASGTAGSGGAGGASGSQGADGGAGGAIATGFGGSVTLTRVVISGMSGAGGSPGNPGVGGKAGLATTGTNGSTGAGGTAGVGGSAGRGGGISSFAPLTIHESVVAGQVGAAGTGANGGLPGGQRGSCCQAFGALTPGAAGGPGANGGAIAQSLASAAIVDSQLQGSAGDGGYGGVGAAGDSNRNGSAGGAGGDGGNGGALDIAVPGGASVQLVNDTIAASTRGAGGQGGSGGLGKVNGAAGATGATGTVGGVQRTGSSPVTLQNSIVEGFNSAAGNGCAAGVTDGGHDLVWPDTTCPGAHTDPLLVLTVLPDGRQLQGLDPGSPAIDQVPSAGAGCPAVDIRGHARPVGPKCDIGAWEHTPAPVCSDQDVTVPYETATTVTLACTIGDPSDPGSIVTSQDPAHGTFDGQRAYTPAAGYVGPDTVRYRLFNGDGNSAPATIHLTVAPPAAPTITGTTPASPAQAGSPRVTGTAPAGSTVSLFTTADCSGAPAVTGSAAAFASPGLVVPTSGDGTTTITARYVDSESVTSACSTATSFTVDSAAPDTLIDGGPSGTTTDAQPTFTFHASEAGATFACSVDTGTPSFAPCSGPGGAHRPAAPLTPGTYTFRVRATDAAGNTDASPATRTFTIAAPGSGTTGGGTGGTTGGSGGTGTKRPDTIITRHPKARLTVRTARGKVAVRFGFRATQAGATFTCRLDRQKGRACRSPKRYRVGRGRHVFTVTARTKAGVDPTPARFRFTVKVRRV